HFRLPRFLALARLLGHVGADLHWPGRLIRSDDVSAIRYVMLGHLQRARRCAVAEQTFALAEDDRRDHQRELVEESRIEQLRIERAAALDDDVWAVALLD